MYNFLGIHRRFIHNSSNTNYYNDNNNRYSADWLEGEGHEYFNSDERIDFEMYLFPL